MGKRVTDVIIAGAGISGMLSAWYLSEAGLKVTLMDQAEPGRESSWAGGGIISPLYPWRYPAAVNHLAKWSQQHFATLVAELQQQTGIDPEYLSSGLLMPSLSEAEYQQAKTWAATYPAKLQELDSPQLNRVQAGLNVPPGHHLFLPEVCQVRNPRLLQALLAALKQRGVAILPHHPVSRPIREAGRVVGVEVNGELHRASTVVLCVGAWTAQLIDGPAIQPVRGQMLLFQADPRLLQRILLTEDTYLIPRRDGKILAGSTMEYVGFDKSTTNNAREDLFQRATQRLPALVNCPVIHHWAGLRPGSTDGIPTISPVPGIEGLFINAGQFRNGVVTSPASARLLSDLVLNKPPILNPSDYQLPCPT